MYHLRLDQTLELQRVGLHQRQTRKKDMEEEEKDYARLLILCVGVFVYFFILCCGIRQLALLDDRIQSRQRYQRLEQELVPLSADDFFGDDELSDDSS